MEDTVKTLTSSARRFFSGTLLSRSTGFIREVMMALFFGTAPAVAAFWMAFRFAHLLRRVFGEGALHLAFVPHFEALRKESPARASRFFYDLSCALMIVLGGVVIVAEAAMFWWLHTQNPSPSTAEVIHLTQLLLPAILPIVLYALNISFLNCQQSYFLPSAAPIALNLVWIGAIFFLRHKPLNEAMATLAFVLMFAFLLQWGVTLPRTCHLLNKGGEGKRTPLKTFASILRPFTLAVIGVTATQINSALDAIFARIASPEGPAYLWYAIRIQQLPLALFGMAAASALLPPLSRATEQKKSALLLKKAAQQIVVWMTPTTIVLLLFAEPIIRLVYYRGAFTDTAVIETMVCLKAYSVGLVPMGLVMILAAPFYAKKNYLTPTLLGLGSVALNLSLNALFVFYWGLGPKSIALATSISATFNAAGLAVINYGGPRIRKQSEC